MTGYARVAIHDHRFQRGATLEQQRGQQKHWWLWAAAREDEVLMAFAKS